MARREEAARSANAPYRLQVGTPRRGVRRSTPLITEIVPTPEPARCCERLEGLPHRLFLDSIAQTTRLGQYSFLMADPVALVRSKGRHTECLDLLSGARRLTERDPLDAVRSLLAPFACEPVPELPPFQGGAAGYLAYDWGTILECLPTPRHDDLALDDVVLGIYDWVLAWDHTTSRAWLISTGIPESSSTARMRRAQARTDQIRTRLESEASPSAVTSTTLRTALERDADPAPTYALEGAWWDPCLDLRSSFTHRAYLDAVERVREYIFAGDIFQANLSQRFEAPLHESPWALYHRLRQRNAVPFAAFLDFPDVSVLSASPERFLRVDTTGFVETRPIKGTRPRGLGPEHDAALGQALTESEKDRAENLMIVDLMRNDLSRVCAAGSVGVPELFALERYSTVHHLVSTVVGQLRSGADALDLLRAAFPGGSITGAPKLRAMEIITELEPASRSVYCGSIGYWSVTGALDTSIAIRTALARNGRVYFSAGGGIVADSDPELEYRETLDKARAIIDALAKPS